MRCGIREAIAAMEYVKDANRILGLISRPVPFKQFARAVLSAQTSPPSVGRLLSHLGSIEGTQRKSLLSRILEMLKLIKAFVKKNAMIAAARRII